MWISVDDVVGFTGLKPQHLGYAKDDKLKLGETVGSWILQSQDLINVYCKREYTDDNVREAVRNVCLRLTSNMVSLAIQKRDNPIIKVNDWTVQGLSSDVFTDDLKDDLRPFINDSSNNMSSIGILAITGSDTDGTDNL